jgi:TatD DNase family protein
MLSYVDAGMRIPLIDTHCHLDFYRFDHDRADVIDRAIAAGVMRIMVPGLDIASSQAAIMLSDQYDIVYAAVGFHPNSIGPDPGDLPQAMNTLREMAEHHKVAAIGEIGLDYYWDTTPPDIQKRWLAAQLELAAVLGKPVILHNRDATADLLELLGRWTGGDLPASLRQLPGVLHSFSAGWSDAEQALAMGFYMGFTGPITYRNADEVRRVAAQAPEDRIVIETDAPFLTPQPRRGQRNEPAFVIHTAEELARIRGCTLSEIASMTSRNASNLFRWQVSALGPNTSF